MLLAIPWIVLCIVWFVAGLFAKPVARSQSAPSRLLHMLLTLAGYVLIFNWNANWGPLDRIIFPRSNEAFYAGFAMTVASILFTLWARFYLGGNWSGSVTVKENHELVRTGPYAIVRHPIYTGLIFAGLGGAISLGRIRGFIGVALLTFTFKIKSRLEERFMQEQFGDQYVTYKRQVKALVPFIW